MTTSEATYQFRFVAGDLVDVSRNVGVVDSPLLYSSVADSGTVICTVTAPSFLSALRIAIAASDEANASSHNRRMEVLATVDSCLSRYRYDMNASVPVDILDDLRNMVQEPVGYCHLSNILDAWDEEAK